MSELKLGNPCPVAMGAFALTTFVLKCAKMGFDETKRILLESSHPGVSIDDVQKRQVQIMNYSLKKNQNKHNPSTKEELRVLREEIDPFKTAIERKAE